MAGGYKFAPLNVRAVYQNDGSAKATFLAEVASMTNDAGRMFKDFSNEARNQLDAALAVKRNSAGSLDLGVDELRAAAAAQQARATAAREVAAATALAAKEEGDYSQKARLAVAATQALAIEEEKAAASARAHAQAAEQVQARLNRQASATDLVVAATRRGTTESTNVINGLRAQRAAYGQLGQQLQDVTVQWQMGTSAATIFTQQVPQMAFALSGLSESTNKFQSRIGKVASFLSSPWGAAIFAATAVMAPFILKLFEADNALAEQAKRLSDAAKSADSYGNAQSILSQVIDLTTGKLKTQNNVLVQTIKLQAQANILAAQAAQKSGLGKVGGIGERSTLENLGAAFRGIGGTLGGGRAGDAGRQLEASLAPLRKDLDAYKKSAEEYQRVLNDPKAGSAAIEAASARFNKSLDVTLDKLSSSAKKGNRDVIQTKQQVLELGSALNDQRANQLVVDAIGGKPLDPLLTPYKAPAKPEKERKDTSAERAAKAAMRLGEFGEDSGKKIANIRDAFSTIPPEIERINRASRELDDIISDLMNRKPVGFAELKSEAEALKQSLADGVISQALDGMADSSQRQLQIQEMLLSGRDAEATALQNVWQIEKSLGSEAELRAKAQVLILKGREEEAAVLTRIANQYPRIRSEVQGIADAEQKRIEAMKRAQEIQSVFLDSTRAVRGEVEAILGGYGSIGDLASTLRRSFQQIQGKILTEKIFGDVFRDMDRYVKEKTGIGSSVDMLAKETVRAGEAAATLADELLGAAQRISGGGGSGRSVPDLSGMIRSGGWNWTDIGIPPLLKAPANENYDPNAPIVVEGKKPTGTRKVNDLTPEEYFRKMGQDVGAKWAGFLEPLLGKKLAGNLGGVLGGVLEGQATTGTGFGAILGGLKELKGLPKGLSEGLGKAFSGAQTGAAVAGIGNALGLKMSNTGAQVGGAIGKFIPIPGGGIIGAIAGGLIGNLFKTVKSGYAQVRNGDIAGTYGRTGQLQNDAREAAGGLIDTISSLSKTLGTTLGNYDFDFGKKDNKFVVNTGSRGVATFDDEKQAMEFAVREAVADGAFVGLSEGAKRLLQRSGDLEAQVQKAVSFQNVFKQLKSIKDPLGSALDELNSEFTGLIDIFKEAGASTAEYASLEELYGLKRADAIKQATESMTSSLKGLLEELNIGSDYFSLRDRKSSALEVYNPLKDRVAAGDTTAFEAFSEAARNLISIEREISGSTSPFFALLQEVTTLSQNALTGQSASISAASASDSPFAALAAQNAATASAIDNQTDALITAIGGRLDLVNANLIAALRNQSVQAANSNVPSLAVGGFW